MSAENIHGKPISTKKAFEGLGDPSTWEAEKKALMKEFREKPNYDYPEDSIGTRIAAEVRERCNKLSPEERSRLLNEGMEKIYNASSETPLPKWEYFCDESYYDYWAVREVGETRWGHCFHLCQKREAEALCNLLNSLKPVNG